MLESGSHGFRAPPDMLRLIGPPKVARSPEATVTREDERLIIYFGGRFRWPRPRADHERTPEVRERQSPRSGRAYTARPASADRLPHRARTTECLIQLPNTPKHFSSE